jgi:hypothetical protein
MKKSFFKKIIIVGILTLCFAGCQKSEEGGDDLSTSGSGKVEVSR